MEESTFRWVISGLAGAFFIMIGWLGKRQSDTDKKIDDVAQAASASLAEVVKDSAESRSKQWDAINRQSEKHHDLERRMFQEMATKEDLRAMEGRITDTIKQLRTQQ